MCTASQVVNLPDSCDTNCTRKNTDKVTPATKLPSSASLVPEPIIKKQCHLLKCLAKCMKPFVRIHLFSRVLSKGKEMNAY
jgi:hypothetical protein